MISFDSIQKASNLVSWLAGEFNGVVLPANLRTRLSASCFAVTQEHHHAIVLCLSQEPALHASAFALVRVQYEAYVRGMWISHCATDDEVDAFSRGTEPPKMSAMISAIEKASTLEGQRLSSVHKYNWKAMCAYAHTGAQQVQRWNTSDGVEANYHPEEVREVLAFTGAIALLSAVSVAALGNNDALANAVLEKSGISEASEF